MQTEDVKFTVVYVNVMQTIVSSNVTGFEGEGRHGLGGLTTMFVHNCSF